MSLNFLPLIGIDIGASAIKVVELAGKGPAKKLKAMGLELMPENTIVDGVIQDDQVVEDTLMGLLYRLKIDPRGRRAAIAIRGTGVQIKRVLVDLGRGDLEDQINYEAEQYFQSDLSELYFKYVRFDNWTEDPARIPVLLVGAPTDSVDQQISIIRGVGLRTGVVDCAPLCLANAFEYNYEPQNTLIGLLEIGADDSRFSLICNEQFILTKTVPVGGAEYTKQIVQMLGVEPENAEALKLSVGQSGASIPEEMQRVISELNEVLISEVQETLNSYFESSTPIPGVTGIDRIMLAGGGARIVGLDAMLAGVLQIPVQVINPFSKININPRQFEVDYTMMQGHTYSVAVGLALRQIGDDAGA